MANTNNKKVIDKDYLAKQLYIYHKDYTRPLDNGKQNNLEITSNHISFEDEYKLGLKIINDDTAKANDYLSLVNEDGDMTWKTPKDTVDYYDDANNDTLITAKALASFVGSDTIKIVGNIEQGNWKVGNISITRDDLDFGKINFNVDTDNKQLLISPTEEEWKIKSSADFDINKLSSSEITVGNTKITEEKIEANNLTFGKVSLTADEDNLKITKENEAFVDFDETPLLLKELKTLKDTFNKNYLIINNTKYTMTTAADTQYIRIKRLAMAAANLDSEEESQS